MEYQPRSTEPRDPLPPARSSVILARKADLDLIDVSLLKEKKL
jgi:hypothetical protein